MDSVVYYRSKYAKQMEDSCGKELYWKYKPFHDEFIENCKSVRSLHETYRKLIKKGDVPEKFAKLYQKYFY